MFDHQTTTQILWKALTPEFEVVKAEDVRRDVFVFALMKLEVYMS